MTKPAQRATISPNFRVATGERILHFASVARENDAAPRFV
jgi:hypothetical protein